MKAQAVPAITPELCAREVMETVPLVMRFIRMEMRSRRAPSLSVPQFRVLTFLSHKPGAPLSSVAEHLGVGDRVLAREQEAGLLAATLGLAHPLADADRPPEDPLLEPALLVGR